MKIFADNKVFLRSKFRVIVNKPAVVLYVDGEKYVAKCHPQDTFDPLVGLMMCCTKAFGMNYHRLKELLDNAVVYETEEVAEDVSIEEKMEEVEQPAPVSTEVKEKLFILKSSKGRSKGKYVTDFDEDTLKVKYHAEIPYTFANKRRATAFCKKYNLEDSVSIEEILLTNLEETISEEQGE